MLMSVTKIEITTLRCAFVPYDDGFGSRWVPGSRSPSRRMNGRLFVSLNSLVKGTTYS